MIEWLKVILLGIVEGITEFLPISSTGHLVVAAALLDFQNSMGNTFEIFIQLGAVVAVVLFYRQRLLDQVRTLPSSRDTQRFWLAIVIAAVPAAILGFLLRHWIKDELFSPTVVALSLIVGGVIFLLVERGRPDENPTTSDAMQITLKQALIVGLAQTVALIPGVSRSGASIIGGMGAGLSRRAATEFSFFLAIPVLGGATIFDLLDSLGGISGTQLAYLAIGAVVSGLIAWWSIGWLLRYVATNTFVLFGYYRIIAGVLILLIALSGRL